MSPLVSLLITAVSLVFLVLISDQLRVQFTRQKPERELVVVRVEDETEMYR